LVKAQTTLEHYLCELWCQCLDLNEVGIHDKFFELGGNSLQAAQFINQLQERLGTTIFTLTIFDHPTIAAYAKMLEKDYAEAIAKQFDAPLANMEKKNTTTATLMEKDFHRFRHAIPRLKVKPSAKQKKNAPAIFILAPPRSGTSLLRLMLAGHPALFAANELQLLGFPTMEERAKAYAGKFALWKEGLVRTLMELDQCTADEAKQKIEAAERAGKSTQDYYQLLQDRISPRLLVDKSPSYALDFTILTKAEQDFSDAIYIHLLRHPYAMIRSFERMHMDQAMYLHPHSFNARQLGELIWTESHHCIQTFLAQIPSHRKFQLQYEALVSRPEAVMKDLCRAIGLDFHPNLLQPYQDLEQKMVDGIYQDSKPMGDVRLLEHRRINPQLAATWKAVEQDNFLSEKTWTIAEQLQYQRPTPNKLEQRESTAKIQQNNDIAIIGMSGRFPGAKNIAAFWQNLKSGTDVSRTFTAEELKVQGIDPNLLNHPDYVNRGMLLEDADCFDAHFFGYHPKEAMLMDPQHRIFLECAYAALEDAGYDSETYQGAIGIFGGVARNTYLINNVLTHPQFFQSLDDFQQGIALEKDFPATRVAYQLNLKGPAVNVQTACSSSGVAVHLACQSLLAGDSDMLIVGGGRIQPPLETGHLHKEGHALSPDGYCRTFDANAQGMVRGNGMAFIVIKRLEEAIKDGDHIHAVIKGTAINNDGANKIGFTAPSIDGQAKAIEKAYRNANVDPATVTYVECHGTGTALGDPIELAGLTKAFASFTDKKGFCAVGSVKTNIGHLDAGACVAGIIKTVLALENEMLPASLHYERPNPQINFVESPFFVNDRLRAWTRSTQVRRAGVSSFGLGGTNAHIVLEEAPLSKAIARSESTHYLLNLSARTEAALQRSLDQLHHFLQNNHAVGLRDLVATLQLGRKAFDCRLAFPISSLADLKAQLSPERRSKLTVHQIEQENKKVVFLFPGGGAQHSNMGLGLYREEPVFRAAVEACLEVLKVQHDLDLKAVLYPDHQRNEPILNPLHAITLLFSIEYATA
ncbi:MAG: beta-ketoacyl synthase N-terminal-like domain-containing protein, partial [Bacteroidota bacterium]